VAGVSTTQDPGGFARAARLREALAACPGCEVLAAATRLEPIDGGVLRRAWRATLADGRRCFVRHAEVDMRPLGADPLSEWRLLQIASAAGLAPAPLFAAPEAGLLVTEFLEDRSWTEADFANPRQLHRLREVLDRLHGLPVDPAVRRVDFAVQAHRLEALCTAAGVDLPLEAKRAADAAFARIAAAGLPEVLCHNDVGPQNVLEDRHGRLRLVDWEYGGRGLAPFDLAAGHADRRLEPVVADVRTAAEYVQAIWMLAQASMRVVPASLSTTACKSKSSTCGSTP
jgi:aminoglycoside phosphotransferase (APT) family kinase protein